MLIEPAEDGDSVEESLEEKLGEEKALAQPGVNSEKVAVKMFIGAGARLLFYPTLLYNVIRNKFEPDFRWWDQIEQFLLLGAVPFPKDVYRLKDLGVEAVITLNESYETLVSASLYESQRIKHLVIPTQDYLFAPSFENIQRAVDFIYENVQQGKTTYVHCKAGRGRSTTIVLCYLVKHRGMTPSEAFQYVRSKRPRVLLAASQWKAVLRYTEHQNYKCMSYSAPSHWPLSLHGHDDTGQNDALTDSQSSYCGEVPVFITVADLKGYKGIQDAGLIGNGFNNDLGMVYKVRLLAAKSVVGVAKASATLARLSCIWLGCQAGNQAFKLTLTCGTQSVDYQAMVPQHMVSLHVCQGLVEC